MVEDVGLHNSQITNKVIKNKRGKQMRKEREITIKVIENNKINNNRLAEFFARKYSEKIKINKKS